jgi:hypothetical protein
MEFRDLMQRGEQTSVLKFINRLFFRPFLIGILYGIGHFIAYLTLSHRYVRNLTEASYMEQKEDKRA